jgi:pyruvate/2-oxoacid:ferredoxin oxidoreductase beta subunit
MTFVWSKVSQEELLNPGHLACQGCGATIAMRYALKALGKNTVVVVPACCWTIIDGPFPHHSLKVPLFHTAFETTAVVSAGVKAGLEIKGLKDVVVMGWAGDGGTFDIGIQALSGVAERNDDVLYACYDNEAYMNTGIQRSGATPYGAWTTTTPEERPESRPKKNIVEIMRAHRIPYIATVSVAFPEDFIRKFKRAKEIKGTRFIHIYSPCPPGWRMATDLTIKVSRLAVESKVFPLFEIEDGERYTLNYMPKGIPVEEYLKIQGRFKHLKGEDVEYIQKFVDKNFESLLKKHRETHGTIDNIPKDLFYK